ncbi:MAG: UDP-4-amino-4,6-dideoxy-N-acetyl-beta-L-altrosamine transaminase [Vicinamibacterales bacterium]
MAGRSRFSQLVVKSPSSRLAIDGGTPVRKTLLPYGRQTVDAEDIASVVAVLRSDWLTTGPAVRRFEESFAAAIGAEHAVAVSNGTAALHAAMFAAGVGPGDEVITTPLTFVASANAARYQGGSVVFADVQRESLNINPVDVRRAVTSSTKAIVAVDFAGHPADLNELAAIASERDCLLIEDAAHALGATYQGRAVGAIADLTTFSLHPVKHITAGEGGVVATNDAVLANRLRVFRNHGITTDHRQRESQVSWEYEMVDLGYNYRLTDLQCALAESQLRKSPVWLERRREIAAAYRQSLATRSEVECPPLPRDRESAWHLFVLRLNLDRLRTGRVEVFRALRAENIGVNVHYIPVPWHPYYANQGYRRGQWPVAEAEYERVISLPMWPSMTADDVADTVAAVHKVLDAYQR